MATRRRRLTDLYVVGKSVTVADEHGNVDVWVQKLNPLESDNAIRMASAERATKIAAAKDKTTVDWRAAYSDIVEFASREDMVNLAIRNDVILVRTRVELETAAQEEWSKDDYLQGLIDSWDDRFRDLYATTPDDPEAKQVFAELERYDAQVNDLVESEINQLVRDQEGVSDEDLRERGIEQLLEQRATRAFVDEFEIQQLMFSVREAEDHGNYYFDDRREVLALHPKVREQIERAYREISVEPTEGKDLPAPAGSSPSSEAPKPPATSNASGRKNAPL